MNFFTNLTHPATDSLACCNCRTATNKLGKSASRPCPNCGNTMHNMGAGFIPPDQTDKNEWEKVALLVKHNFTFEYLSA